MVLIAVIAIVMHFLIVPFARVNEWLRVHRSLNQTISYLQPTDPGSVDPEVWDCTRGWVMNAFGNICYYPGHPTIDEMYQLRDELDSKLQGKVDLETLKWIWNRLGKIGSLGEDYIENFAPVFQHCLESSVSD